MGRYTCNFFKADVTLAVTAESHAPCASNNGISLAVPAIPQYQYPDANKYEARL